MLVKSGDKIHAVTKQAGDVAGLVKYADDAADVGKHVDDVGATITYSFKNQDMFDKHYLKHKTDFGDITKEAYIEGANRLINSSNSDVLNKVRANGDKVFYNVITNEFAVLSPEGIIRTYFKPTDGINYFHKQ